MSGSLSLQLQLTIPIYYSVLFYYGQGTGGSYINFAVTPPGGSSTTDLSLYFYSNTGSSFATCPTTQVSLGPSSAQCCVFGKNAGISGGCCDSSSTPTFNGGVVGTCCPSVAPYSRVNTANSPTLSCCPSGIYYWSNVCCPTAQQNTASYTCCPTGTYYTSGNLCCTIGLVNMAGICCTSGQINVNMQCASPSLKPNVGLFYQVS